MQPLVLSILLFAVWIAGTRLDPTLAMAQNSVSCLAVCTTRAMAVAAVLNLLLVPLFAHFWGVTGAAAGMALSLVSWDVQTWIDGRRLLGVETSIVPAAWVRLRAV